MEKDLNTLKRSWIIWKTKTKNRKLFFKKWFWLEL